MRALVLAVLLGAALGCASAFALATDPVVRQQGRKFSADSVSVRKGMPLTFLNDDTVPHNIASISKGNEFDLGSQPPGTATTVTFTEAGEVNVICAIHPRMKMTVIVTN